MTAPSRSSSTDVLKAICALLIVFLHCSSTEFNPILPLTRCAVPCFFFISGFYMYHSSPDRSRKKINKSLSKIGKITLFSLLLYTFFELGLNLIEHDQWISVSLKDLLRLLLFNKPPYGYHLWYLVAYLYVLVIVKKYRRFTEVFFYYIPLVILIDLTFGKYSLVLLNHEFATFYFRNFFFYGLPFFLLGQWIARHKVHFTSIKPIPLGCFFLVVLFLSQAEYFLLNTYVTEANGDIYMLTIPLALLLFLLFHNKYLGVRNQFLENIGAKDSLLIYILHPMVAVLLSLALGSNTEFESIWKGYPFALSVFILSLLLSRLIQVLRKYPL